uniref:Uncharacterized protein n=1 Tax=Bracon brevicornis TaxID=1563983 RepID=A0A6V7LDW2_9HYME
MMSNVSLHFSDTDSEDELSIINSKARTMSPAKRIVNGDVVPPVIEVTLEHNEGERADTHWAGMGGDRTPSPGSDRRSSFAENLTDVDEIYVDDPDGKTDGVGLKIPVYENQGETDVEDVEDDGEADDDIVIAAPAIDLLRDFGGGTITTKEGDGPFSVEVRNQMSFDEGDDLPRHGNVNEPWPEGPDTDSENVQVSDDEPEDDGAYGQSFMDLDVLGTSQVVMKNVSKMDNLLAPPNATDDDISDNHTDIEDID